MVEPKVKARLVLLDSTVSNNDGLNKTEREHLDREENKALENVRAWTFMYIEYLFFAMGFTLLIIFGEMGSLSFLL